MESHYLKDRLVAEAIARQAGKFANFERLHGFEISLKARNDIVTTIDVALEKKIRDLLSIVYPEDSFLGEETGTNHGNHQKNGRRWVIDPIDGTLNFSTGVPLYCVSIALQVDGHSVAGAIYDPNRDELFSAHLNGGAYLNGEPIHVSDCHSFDRAVLVTGFPPIKNDGFNNIDNFTKLCKECRAVRRLGSAALDLCYVASGRLDGFWEFGLKPWDTAVGYLMVTEAGGNVTTYQGTPYDAYQRTLIASNGLIHNDFQSALAFDDT